MSKEESVETIHPSNLFVKELVQTNIGLATNHLIESKPNNNFTEPELVQQGDNNMLTKQLVKNQFVTPKFAQSNDISINLITCVDFLGTLCFKSYVFLQALPLSIFQPQYKELMCLLECLFIFSLWISLYSLLYQNEAMIAFRPIKRKSKQEGGNIEKRIFMSTWHNEPYLLR